MLSDGSGQLLALGTYAALAVAIAYARPSRTWGRSPPAPSTERRNSAALGEALWLASLLVVFAYPLGVLLFPSRVLGGPWTLDYPGQGEVSLLGFSFVLAGAAVLGWSLRSLGRFTTVRLQLSVDQEIVREGPYARVRHPIYTGNILVVLGVALAFSSVVLWLPVGIVVGLATLRARAEERLFLASPRLGPEYAAYSARTGRFVPLWFRRPSGEP